MTKARIGGLILVSAGAAIVLLIQAFVLAAKAPDAVHDVIGSYYSAQCLIHHYDPYNPDDVLHIFRAEGGVHSLTNPVTRDVITRYLYPPSAFAVMVPLSLMPWRVAHLLWAFLSSGCLILAAYLAWDLSARDAPILAGAFIGYLLANSYVVVAISNPSELVVGMCVIAVWCFIRERFVAIGILCMALSIAIKPQVPTFVWLYFLFAGGVFRKRALQTLLVTAVVTVPFILWVWIAVPHWSDELRANLLHFSVHGGITDPGPSSPTGNELVDLQVLFSRLYDQPAVYNIASYLLFAPLFIGWLVVSVRNHLSTTKALYALAAIAPLSMLPVYHHFYDTKLLLLTVPALSLLWSHRDRVAWSALWLTAAAFVITGDTSHRFIEDLALKPHLVSGELAERCQRALAVLPAPFILLFTGIFYLWIYWRASQPQLEPAVEQ